MNTLTDGQKAYIAGFVDGEGCVSITKWQGKNNRTPVYALNLIVSQSGIIPLATLMNMTGVGSIHRKKEDPENCAWRINPRNAAALLKDILPYLIIRKEEAELAIEFQSKMGTKNLGGQGYVVPQSVVAEREFYYQEMHRLKGSSGWRGVRRKAFDGEFSI